MNKTLTLQLVRSVNSPMNERITIFTNNNNNTQDEIYIFRTDSIVMFSKFNFPNHSTLF